MIPPSSETHNKESPEQTTTQKRLVPCRVSQAMKQEKKNVLQTGKSAVAVRFSVPKCLPLPRRE
jgi:hypothetical protein